MRRLAKIIAGLAMLALFPGCGRGKSQEGKVVTGAYCAKIADTTLGSSRLELCYDTAARKVNVNYLDQQTGFSPLKGFDLKRTIAQEGLFPELTAGGQFKNVRLLALNNGVVIVPLQEETAQIIFYGIYTLHTKNKRLHVQKAGLEKDDVSYNELSYFDSRDSVLVICQRASLTGDEGLVETYKITGDSVVKTKSIELNWKKYMKEIENSEDTYICYRIVDRVRHAPMVKRKKS